MNRFIKGHFFFKGIKEENDHQDIYSLHTLCIVVDDCLCLKLKFLSVFVPTVLWTILLFVLCVCHAFLSVCCSLVVTWWERADLLALKCDVSL